MVQSQGIRGLAGSSRTSSQGTRRPAGPRSPGRLPVLASAADRPQPHRPHNHRSHGHQQHAAPPASAVPERRASAGAAGPRVGSTTALPQYAPASSLAANTTLRALALSTVALPRHQLEKRFSQAFSEAAEAEAGVARRRGSSAGGPLGLPRLPLPRALARQLARLRRQQQQWQQGSGGKLALGAAAAEEEEVSMSREALTLVLLATAVSFICSIDRAAMSVAILPMSEQFHWDDSIKGSVSSAFFVGYMVTNLCGGFLATRYSAKGVLAMGVVLWSMFTIATPTAAAGNLTELMTARAMMGVGEGVTYPSIQNLVRKWVPDSKRSRALAFIYSGHQLGTIGSYLLCPLLISQLGWESVFWGFGSLGFFWLLFWQPLVSDDPLPAAANGAKASSGAVASTGAAAVALPAAAAVTAALPAAAALGEQQLQGVQQVQQVQAREVPNHELRLQDVPWAQFAGNSAFWAIVAAQCTVSVGNVLAFSWLPTFYNQVYGVDVVASSAYSVLPFVVTVAATNAAGWIADGLVNNKVLDKTSTRKLMQALASLGPAVCLIKLAADQGQGSTASVTDAVALVTAWVSLCGFSAAGYGSNHQDISRQYSGILYGLSNGLASVAASVSIYATGQVLNQTHDWSLVFEVAAGLYAMGALFYLRFASSEEQFAPTAEQLAAPAGAAGKQG